MEDKKITMPAVALRGLTILPGMVQHFDISREKSIRAIETAMMGNQKVYLVTQRHPEQETPAVADLYQMGTISQIKQLVKMPGGIIRVMVEGEKRAALLTLFEEGPYLEAEVEEAPMLEEQLTDTVKEAMSRIVKEKLEEFGNANPKAVKDFIGSLLVTEGIELRCVGVLADKGAALIGNSLGDADNEVRGFLECSVQVIIELL